MMIRTRFAPSPTGFLHIGGVRTALYNWLFAKQHGGQFILRIDDTDEQRNQSEALQPILDGFRWLGIDWDEGPEIGGPHAPYYQSQRKGRYQEAVGQLLAGGFAYWDYATSDELKIDREAAEKAGKTFIYDRRFAADNDAKRAEFEAEGRQGVVRLKMPREGDCVFHDLVAGDKKYGWANEQDAVIQRADGTFLYHLATAIDEHDFAISHVIRGEEHIHNTPRQLFILQSLGFEPPQFAHLPPVAEPNSKNKLSKRKIEQYLKIPEFNKLFAAGEAIANAVGVPCDAASFNPVLVNFYQETGFLPDTINNYLLLLGWSLDGETEEFSREQMLEHFTLDRVNRAPASFDPDKLMAFQARDFAQLDMKKKVAMGVKMLVRAGWVDPSPPCDTASVVQKIMEHPNVKIAGDVLNYPEFFMGDKPMEYDSKAVKKQFKGEWRELISALRTLLQGLAAFDAETIHNAIKEYSEANELKLGKINGPLRVAVTGKSVGIGMYETLEVLGQAECDRRIAHTLEHFSEE